MGRRAATPLGEVAMGGGVSIPIRESGQPRQGTTNAASVPTSAARDSLTSPKRSASSAAAQTTPVANARGAPGSFEALCDQAAASLQLSARPPVLPCREKERVQVRLTMGAKGIVAGILNVSICDCEIKLKSSR